MDLSFFFFFFFLLSFTTATPSSPFSSSTSSSFSSTGTNRCELTDLLDMSPIEQQANFFHLLDGAVKQRLEMMVLPPSPSLPSPTSSLQKEERSERSWERERRRLERSATELAREEVRTRRKELRQLRPSDLDAALDAIARTYSLKKRRASACWIVLLLDGSGSAGSRLRPDRLYIRTRDLFCQFKKPFEVVATERVESFSIVPWYNPPSSSSSSSIFSYSTSSYFTSSIFSSSYSYSFFSFFSSTSSSTFLFLYRCVLSYPPPLLPPPSPPPPLPSPANLKPSNWLGQASVCTQPSPRCS